MHKLIISVYPSVLIRDIKYFALCFIAKSKQKPERKSKLAEEKQSNDNTTSTLAAEDSDPELFSKLHDNNRQLTALSQTEIDILNREETRSTKVNSVVVIEKLNEIDMLCMR